MNRLRYALIAGIFLVAYLLFLEWNAFEAKNRAAQTATEETLTSFDVNDDNVEFPQAAPTLEQTTIGQNTIEGSDDLPEVQSEVINAPTKTTVKPQASLISVKTDAFDMLIDTYGGDIVKLSLPDHLATIDDKDSSFELLNRTDSKMYIAQSGLIGPNGTDKSAHLRPVYTSTTKSYEMGENEKSLRVDLTLEQDNVFITKRFHFERSSHLIKVEYIIDNKSNSLWRAAPYGQIRRSDFKVESDVGFGMQPFLGAAITTDEKNYAKYKFSKIEDKTISTEKNGGWVAMVQHYFISAWVPDQSAKNTYKLRKHKNQNLYILEYAGQLQTVEPNTQATLSSAFYAGPKHIKNLEKIAPYLDLTIDYSFLWFIAKPLFFALDFIHNIVNNWGVAIILLTFLIKLIFLYPSAMSYRSMAKMRKLQPLMAELKERYGDDRQKMSSELMKTYRKEKVNPLGGCLPILLQMPVFISLYWVLMESVELRHAPFMLWITDLSVKDPFFILPLIMGATMFIQQKLNPTPPDPMQAKVMQLMPIFFTLLFLMFPAGLVLYWVVNNTLSIIQQYIITRQIERAG